VPSTTPAPPPPRLPLIRRARPDELDAVGRLTVDAYVGGGVIPPDALYVEFLGDARHRDAQAELWVAVDGRGIVGTVTFVEPGSALAEVARTHQVLVVTHLAQVAAQAADQIAVTKDVIGDETVATAVRVTGRARVEEIARMLSGELGGTAAERHAADLLGVHRD